MPKVMNSAAASNPATRAAQHGDQQVSVRADSPSNFWMTVHDDWPSKPYSEALLEGLLNLFASLQKSQGLNISKILDLGAGAGNPSIGLAEKGFSVLAVESDFEMLTALRSYALGTCGASLEIAACDWIRTSSYTNTVARIRAPFDLGICRGNTLIYAASWGQTTVRPNEARRKIQAALNNVFRILRPGGVFYVDITPRVEYGCAAHYESIGLRHEREETIFLYWLATYDHRRQVRTVDAYRIFHPKSSHGIRRILTHKFVSYHMTHLELVEMAQAAGFDLLQEYADVPGEEIYDVFLFRKP